MKNYERLKAACCLQAVLAAGLFLQSPAVSSAAFGSADKGTSSGQFLKLGAGARAAGMGEAYSSIADDASAIYWNPAALARIGSFSAMFMHAALLADVSYEFLGFGRRLGGSGTVGLGIQYLSMPVFHETNSSGFETGNNLNPRDTGLTLAYAVPLGENYSVGLAGKRVSSELDSTASAYAADFGILAMPAGRDLRFSFVVQNLGGKLKFEQRSDPLPLNVKLGSSLAVGKDWLIGLDLNSPRDNRAYAALGTEYRFRYGADLGFAGRLGFNTRTLGDVSGFTGVSAGAGLNFRQYWLDYAFLPFGTLGMTHRISITVGFGRPEASTAGNFGELVSPAAADSVIPEAKVDYVIPEVKVDSVKPEPEVDSVKPEPKVDSRKPDTSTDKAPFADLLK